ncbi:hypothetical protein ACN06F_09300 [Vreelandella sp. 21]|uniref:hypothetical protein n=1 Tax=Vreelandella sp. 21 TaxID=3402864 RepID=UPI003D9A890C
MNVFQSSGKGKSRVTIDGRDFVGRYVVINGDGHVTVDGVAQSGSLVGPVTVEIHGDTDKVEVAAGSVSVTGSCSSAKTQSGDITCGDVTGSVSSMSGDIRCKHVAGSCKTMSGDIYKG